jgi:hypothetical protein
MDPTCPIQLILFDLIILTTCIQLDLAEIT